MEAIIKAKEKSMPTCCVCLNKFEGEDAPILMMDGEGEARVLCPECAAILDKIAGTPDSPEREAAVRELYAIIVKDPTVAAELAALIHHEDAPLEEDEAFEEEEEIREMPVAKPTAVNRASNLWLYMGIGCLAAAVLIFILVRFVL